MSDTYICPRCLDRDHNGCQGRAWDFNDDKPCRCWCPVCREENREENREEADDA